MYIFYIINTGMKGETWFLYFKLSLRHIDVCFFSTQRSMHKFSLLEEEDDFSELLLAPDICRM